MTMESSTKPEGDYVWDIFENAWVTRDYWQYVNQRGQYAPKVSSGK